MIENTKIILAHDFNENNKYKKYLDNLNNIVKSNPNIIIEVRTSHGHLTGNIRNAFKHIDTEYVLILQHDLPFIFNFDISKVIEDMKSRKDIKFVIFNCRENIKIRGDALNDLFGKEEKSKNYTYTRTPRWTDQNHLCHVDYYKNIVLKECADGDFMEHTLHGLIKNEEIHRKYGTYLFGKNYEKPYIRHIDARKKSKFFEKLIKNEQNSSKLNIITFATDENKLIHLKNSEKLFNTKINYILKQKWEGLITKIKAIREIVSILDDDEIVLFIDAYDVLLNSNFEEIINKFKNFNCNILFSAEMNGWPKHLKNEMGKIYNCKNKFLNSGGYIGYNKYIKECVFNKPEKDIIDICRLALSEEQKKENINNLPPRDQTYFTHFFIENFSKMNIKLDTNSSIFQNMFLINWNDFEFKNGRIYNKILKNFPCFIHFNGLSYRLEKTKENAMPIFIKKMIRSNRKTVTFGDFKQHISKHCIPISQL